MSNAQYNAILDMPYGALFMAWLPAQSPSDQATAIAIVRATGSFKAAIDAVDAANALDAINADLTTFTSVVKG